MLHSSPDESQALPTGVRSGASDGKYKLHLTTRRGGDASYRCCRCGAQTNGPGLWW
jgi:hypothetical protein